MGSSDRRMTSKWTARGADRDVGRELGAEGVDGLLDLLGGVAVRAAAEHARDDAGEPVPPLGIVGGPGAEA